MGRTSDGRERLLQAASTLFGQRSYGALGVAEICALAGVQKGSFYYFFESKQALALAVIDEHWAFQRAEWTRILVSGEPLPTRLRDLFRLTSETQVASRAGTGSVTGCLFGNLALEVGGTDEPIRKRLQGIFEEQVDLIEAALKDPVAGISSGSGDSRELAKSVVAQLEGLVLFAKLFNDPSQLDHLWENTMRLLGVEEARQV